MNLPTLSVALLALLVVTTVRGAETYHEQYRPQFHFSPQRGWMNDPNGLVYFDGEYHLFFQHRPDTLEQTPVMSWGHAVSDDLVHWKELSIALKSDENDGWIWSGSAVLDSNNTSGLGDGTHPPLVAIYTAAKKPFAQAIASSLDRGRTWTKYADNPVVAHIANDNRDPHVFWHEPTKRWVMVLYKDQDNTFCILSSADLKAWMKEQEFQMPGCTECPDFFPLALDGDASKIRWVFTAANGKYLVGDFDGHHFTPQQEVRQVDFGRNFYAVQSFNDIPSSDGRRIQMAWMMGGKYPQMPFNQQMTFPAELTLRTTSDGPRLFRNPVREIERLHAKEHRWKDVTIKPGGGGGGGENPFADIKGDLLDIQAYIDPGDAKGVSLIVSGQSITFDCEHRRLSALGEAELPPTDEGLLHLRILADRTSIETFANGGRISLSSCFVPDEKSQPGVSILATGGSATVRSLVVYELKSAWR